MAAQPTNALKLIFAVMAMTGCLNAMMFNGTLINNEQKFTAESYSVYFGGNSTGNSAPEGALSGAVSVTSDYIIWTSQPVVNGKYQIPYRFDSTFPRSGRATVRAAFNDFTTAGLCLEFVPYSRGTVNYLLFQRRERGCWSYVGRLANSANPINLGEGCLTKGTILHEILHALGFIHEHSRPDRDDYIRVNKELLGDAYDGNFEKASANDINSLGVDYDVKSIMQYHPYAGSPDGETPVITQLNGEVPPFPNENDMRPSDIKQVELLYRCSGFAGTATPEPQTEAPTNPSPEVTSDVATEFTEAETGPTLEITTHSTPTESTGTTDETSEPVLPGIILNCADAESRAQCQIYVRRGWHVTRPGFMKDECEGTADFCECRRQTRGCPRRNPLDPLDEYSEETSPNEGRCARPKFVDKKRCWLACGFCGKACRHFPEYCPFPE